MKEKDRKLKRIIIILFLLLGFWAYSKARKVKIKKKLDVNRVKKR